MDSMTSLDLDLATRPVSTGDGCEFALASVAGERRLVAAVPRDLEAPGAFEGDVSEHAGRLLTVGPLSARNAAALRARLPWLRPALLGLRTSAGFGDRLGLATPGHIRALRSLGAAVPGGAPSGSRIAPIFAQQSMREMSRTGRSAQQVVDDAMWAVFAEDWREGFGADADHLKQPGDIDTCLAAGFTFYTIDPGEHVQAAAGELARGALRAAFDRLPWPALEDSSAAFQSRYAGYACDIGGRRIKLTARAAMVAAVKYGPAVAHVTAMYRHLVERAGSRPFELEVSLDETDTPTSPGEHVYVALELGRLGVRWVSLAPRFVGRFEKGVDYIGDLSAFASDIAVHAGIARALGPYKISLHSGSDKFSIYEPAARATAGAVHLKTAGTSWLEALRTVAAADAALFREIYSFSRGCYATDRATYHVSATLEAAPPEDSLSGPTLAAILDDFHARQILHVTFGSVLTAREASGRPRFADRLMALLRREREGYAENLVRHFRRHLEPFAREAS